MGFAPPDHQRTEFVNRDFEHSETIKILLWQDPNDLILLSAPLQLEKSRCHLPRSDKIITLTTESHEHFFFKLEKKERIPFWILCHLQRKTSYFTPFPPSYYFCTLSHQSLRSCFSLTQCAIGSREEKVAIYYTF